MGYLALSKYLPVYAIPHAAPRPWPREPVATSVKACFCRKRDPQLSKGPGKSISNTPPPTPGSWLLWPWQPGQHPHPEPVNPSTAEGPSGD